MLRTDLRRTYLPAPDRNGVDQYNVFCLILSTIPVNTFLLHLAKCLAKPRYFSLLPHYLSWVGFNFELHFQRYPFWESDGRFYPIDALSRSHFIAFESVSHKILVLLKNIESSAKSRLLSAGIKRETFTPESEQFESVFIHKLERTSEQRIKR